MSNFEIITDITADLYEGYYEQNPTIRMPFPYVVDGKAYGKDNEYPLDEFYQALKEGKLVKTSQVNQQDAANTFDEVLARGKDILYVCFSSGMSGSFDNTSYIAKGLRLKYPDRRIEIVDSLSGAGGEGLLVYYAKKMQDEGKSLDEIVAWLEKNKLNTHHLFIVNDLANLRHSGRISTIAALVGMVVKIKPLFELTRQGKVGVLAKALGRKKAISDIVEYFKRYYKPEMNDFILIGHTNCPEDAQELANRLTPYAQGVPIKFGYLNRLVAGNAGYNSLVVYCMGSERLSK